MKEEQELLQAAPLFKGIEPEQLTAAAACLGATRRKYEANETILQAGRAARQIGVLLRGRARVLRTEYTGTQLLVAELDEGETFAEVFACAAGRQRLLPVSVEAQLACTVLWLDPRRLAGADAARCPFHARLIENMLGVLAGKALLLNRRLGHLAKRTTREKLLSYLEEQALAAQSDTFSIPLDRQALADYLCVERSAMSAELSKLRREGILETRRSRFVLKIHSNRYK